MKRREETWHKWLQFCPLHWKKTVATLPCKMQ